MNEQLQNALSELLGKANNGIDTAGEFLVSELPGVIQQLLMWYGVKSAIACLIGLALFYFVYKINKIQVNFWKKDEDFHIVDHPEIMLNLFQVGWVPIILSQLNIEWLQIWIAPKIWLIEYAAKLAG